MADNRRGSYHGGRGGRGGFRPNYQSSSGYQDGQRNYQNSGGYQRNNQGGRHQNEGGPRNFQEGGGGSRHKRGYQYDVHRDGGYQGGPNHFRNSGSGGYQQNYQGREQGHGGGSQSGGHFEDRNVPMAQSEVHQAIVKQQMAPGTLGRQVNLLANFYKITTADVVVYHYDVDISREERNSIMLNKSDKLSSSTTAAFSKNETNVAAKVEEANKSFVRFLSKCSIEIIRALVANNQAIFKDVPYVWDGPRNLYTTRQLNLSGNDGKEQEFSSFQVTFPGGRPGIFKLKIKRVDRVDLSEVTAFYNKKTDKISERALFIFDLVLRFICSGHYENYQRKYFNMDTREWLGRNAPMADFVQGFISSVRMTEFGLALNVHLKTAGLISRLFTTLDGLVASLAGLNQDLSTLQSYQYREINKVLRHLKIYTVYGKGRGSSKNSYTVDRLISETPYQKTFILKTGDQITVAQYFKDTYNINLRNWPLVQTAGFKCHIPLELCYLVDRQFLSHSKEGKNVQNELLRKSTLNPNVYFNRAGRIVEQVNKLNPALMSVFGLNSISLKPVQLIGRQLPPPRMVGMDAGNGQQAPTKFARGGTEVPLQWGILVLDQNVQVQTISRFVELIHKQAQQLGLAFKSNPYPVAQWPHLKSKTDIKNIFTNLKSNWEEKVQGDPARLIFVGLPSKPINGVLPSVMYNLIKHYCDQRYGIISCCIKAEYMQAVVSNNKRGYMENFLLKVNGKLGGANRIIDPRVIQQELPFDMARTMVMGVDVNHPGATEKVLSSIAAAVGSTDEAFTQYAASIRVQKKEREEIVKQLDDMTAELLEEYQKKNGYYPENIFVFRDGVSEGQFEQVKTKEIPLIRAAAKKVCKSYKLSVVVTQKRHHTRFVLTEAVQAGRYPSYNVPSGTVVDQSIVEPVYDVFYLNSHYSPLGTSKPTKYIRLLDELKMSTDHLQKFCFYACHNCIRTNKIIAIPTAVRYADLCAYRSKLHIEGQRELEYSCNESSSQEAEEQRIIGQLNEWVKIHANIRNRLYYC